MWRRRLLLPLVLVLAAAPLSACAVGSSGGESEVVASFYPLQYVAERVVGEHAEVTNLTEPGVEPHDLELSPQQVAEVSGASVLLYEKGLQPAVDDAVSNDEPDHVVDAASVVDLHHADEHAGVEGSEGEDHDHGGVDPHFWQDPTLLAETAAAFTEEISKADPDHAADFEANNRELQADLASLDEEFTAGLKDCTTRTVVVSHDAFGYLGERYDLDIRSIAGLSPDAEPSPKHLAELSDLIRADHITTVFSERLASPAMADTLASDLDITSAVLDPIEGLTSDNDEDDYLSLMRANLQALREAGGCT